MWVETCVSYTVKSNSDINQQLCRQQLHVNAKININFPVTRQENRTEKPKAAFLNGDVGFQVRDKILVPREYIMWLIWNCTNNEM
jgi:hypothetical protein